jgi:hypothetical protein
MRYRRGWGMDQMVVLGREKESVQGWLCSLCRARRRAPWVGLLWAVKIVNFPHMPWDMDVGEASAPWEAARTRPEGRRGRALAANASGGAKMPRSGAGK